MKLSKKAVTLALALTMLASATTAFAAPGVSNTDPGKAPGDAEMKANGNTTISIMEANQSPSNVSFEVPLYITMAVVTGQAAAIVPSADAYKITNTSAAGSGTAFPIGVTRLNFESLGKGWKTVAAANVGNDAKNICLTIHGVEMPALSAAKSEFVSLAGSDFMKDKTAGTTAYKSIAPGASMNLPIAGTVASTTRTDTGAAAQFKVKYTISALDANGNALGTAYAGDDRVQAGLGAFVAP